MTYENGTTAFHQHEDGETWLRICPPDARDWQEPIVGWELVIEIDNSAPPQLELHGVSFPATTYYRHCDGRKVKAA